MTENGRKKKLGHKETRNKVPLMFLVVKSGWGKVTIAFLDSITNKQRTV